MLLSLLAPIVGLLLFSARDIKDKYATLEDISTTRTLTLLAIKTGTLVHEIQKERGLSSGYINSKGQKFRDELTNQRQLVNTEIKNVTEFAGANAGIFSLVRKPLDAAATALGKLAETRNAIDGFRMEGKDSFQYFTGLIASQTDIMAAVATSSANSFLSREATTYYTFVMTKEETGKERATLNAVLAANNFTNETFMRTIAILAAQQNYYRVFSKFATSDEMAAYENKAKNPSFQKTKELEDAVLSKGLAGDFGIAPETWFSTITEKINIMKEAEDEIARHILSAADEVAASSKTTLITSISISAILTIIALGLGFLVMRSITSPLVNMQLMLKDIAEGEGDLTKRLETDRSDELGELGRWFNRFVDNIHSIVSQVAGTTIHVSSSADQLNSTAEQIATAAEEVASQSATVATASEEMSATSNDIASNCSRASEVANRASDTAKGGATIVHETLSGMERIAERVKEAANTVASLGARSDQIGAIVGTIEDIADQTNLLALNAAIEAARAGEQGRGFAVVADEVRALAERTTKATKEIGEMIKVIQQETTGAVSSMENGVAEVERGMKSSRKSGTALEEIVDAINEVTMQVHQIATAAEEQTAVTGEISSNIHQITDVVHETARGAHKTANAASQLLDMSNNLQRLVKKFKLT